MAFAMSVAETERFLAQGMKTVLLPNVQPVEALERYKMTLESDDIIDIKARWNKVQVELAKFDERRTAAKESLRKARAGLADLGVDPDDAHEEVERLARGIDKRLSELEIALGIK